MVKMTYVGLSDPRREFEILRPAVLKLQEMGARFRPGSEQYWALHFAQEAVRNAADVCNQYRDFYHMTSGDGARGPYRGPVAADPSRRGWDNPVIEGKIGAGGVVEAGRGDQEA